mgnify:CR=1 FL=1
MEKLFRGKDTRIGNILDNGDANIVQFLNIIFKTVFPDYTLIAFADPDNEPTSPLLNDCYLVSADGTIWGSTVEKDHVLRWDGLAWEVMEYKTTELYYPLWGEEKI